ncbi:hypothetical protein A3K87_14890 [Variovorax paradoxus]|uniref:DUF4880 domain-containing protein n=1 Tax=Variovorax paradoxus TaxID=34073 RepID=A0AA91IBE9_VARPD|nr:hypothetical protein [Variovorax paradoxus]OAK64656.1 hypothetical protein A3K87_14890 [Variovorax paradoxus]
MNSRHQAPSDPAFSEAWRLFRALHDAPSLDRAQKLVLWLGRDAKHVRAFDEALTLWALAGAAMVGSAPGEESRHESTLQ